MVTIDNVAAAAAAVSASSPLSVSFRLDAEHNETCIQDSEGNKIDFDAAEATGLTLDLDLSVDEPQTLVINSKNGSVFSADTNALLATVCQFSPSVVSLNILASDFDKVFFLQIGIVLS